MDGSIARSQVRNQSHDYVIGHRNESIAEKRNHVAEGLKGMQVYFAVSVCESRTEDIKYLFGGRREKEREHKIECVNHKYLVTRMLQNSIMNDRSIKIPCVNVVP